MDVVCIQFLRQRSVRVGDEGGERGRNEVGLHLCIGDPHVSVLVAGNWAPHVDDVELVVYSVYLEICITVLGTQY